MAQSYAFNKANKGATDAALDFKKLKLEKKGEKARLAIFSIQDGKLAMPQPEGGYFFDLRIPGAEREYVGSFECLADEDTKMADGYDPDACAHCAAVLAGNVSEEVMRKRIRRFVMPVIRYQTKANSSELVTPNSVEALAWRFTDRYFNVLIDENEKWIESGGLLGHDITLTCEAVQYQNFVISVEPEAAYAKNKDTLGKLVIETYLSQTAGLTSGLGRILGSRIPNVDLEKKIQDTITSAAQFGYGGPTATAVASVDPATIENLAADLLGTSGNGATEADVSAILTADESDEAGATAVTEESTEAAAEVDFDEFFSN